MSEKLLEMKDVDKQFPGVYALKGANFELKSGEVHALLGENGAGKSTLMKILGGIYSIDKGRIFINGKEQQINSVKDAKQLGISIIHQELALVPHLSIAENIYLGREVTTKTGLVNFSAMNRNVEKLLNEFGMNIDPRRAVSSLTVAQQQMVEIIKAVSFNSRIIVMDEPTSSLTEKEVTFLFNTIRNLKENGVGIIYISHRMEELFEISDRITVLRDGEYVGTVLTRETNQDELIRMMVGRKLENYYVRDFQEVGEPILEVRNLTRKSILEDINFDLRKGEILGFAGLVGAGRSELMKCIFGLDSYEKGEIYINGNKVHIQTPNDAIDVGIAYVPEDRKAEGLFLIETIKYNISLKILHKFIKNLSVNKKIENAEVQKYIDQLSIRTPSSEQSVNKLSGGNQQKVLIAKWLATGPKVLILDEPTRGVDVGAKAEIYSIMNDLVKEGVSIIMVSSDLPEIINMSDRVAVMANGKLQKILEKEDCSQEKIMFYATGGK